MPLARVDQISCHACHMTLREPAAGGTVVKRGIRPFAPPIYPDRFTNESKVEAWFGWNCKLLLKRECTPLEKGVKSPG